MTSDHEPRGVEGEQSSRWLQRGVLLVACLVVAYVLYLLSAAFFPRWWAQRVADQVQGDFTAGVLWGLFYGFLFTFVPLLLLFQLRRKVFSWPARATVAVVALLLAAPNWLTLSVVLGSSKAAHAGERIMDVDAPAFRTSSLIGVLIAAVLAVVITGTSMMMKHRKNQMKSLKEELSHRPKPEPDAPPR